MGSTKIFMKRDSSTGLKEVADSIREKMESSLVPAELVSEHLEMVGDVEIFLLVFEKYYARIGGMAALSVQGINYENHQSIQIVGTGGGDGVFNISWGANKDFAIKVVDHLETLGFTKEDEK